MVLKGDSDDSFNERNPMTVTIGGSDGGINRSSANSIIRRAVVISMGVSTNAMNW